MISISTTHNSVNSDSQSNDLECIKRIQQRLIELIEIENTVYHIINKSLHIHEIHKDAKMLLKKVQRNISHELKILSTVVHTNYNKLNKEIQSVRSKNETKRSSES
jgi:hypothetical protein